MTQLDTAEVIEHALNVLKNLPGGFFIFGVFIVASKEIFSDAPGLVKLKSLIINLQHNIKVNATLRGDTDTFDAGEKLILWYSSSNNSCVCKAMSSDGSKGAQLKGIDWKFVTKHVQWVMIETYYEINEMFQLPSGTKDTEAAIKQPLNSITNEIMGSRIFYNGTPLDSTATLESLVEGKKSKEIKADIYKSLEKNEIVTPVQLIQSVIKFRGTLASRVWVPVKATAGEVEGFIKDDICRTLGIRLQILTDSLVDDKVVDNDVLINEPPRRIYFPIKYENIQFCEHLFPNETAKTVLSQIKENLDVDLKVDQIITTVEAVAEVPTVSEKKSEQVDSAVKVKDNSKIYIIGVVAALLVLLLSIVIHYAIK